MCECARAHSQVSVGDCLVNEQTLMRQDGEKSVFDVTTEDAGADIGLICVRCLLMQIVSNNSVFIACLIQKISYTLPL